MLYDTEPRLRERVLHISLLCVGRRVALLSLRLLPARPEQRFQVGTGAGAVGTFGLWLSTARPAATQSATEQPRVGDTVKPVHYSEGRLLHFGC